MSGTEPTSLGEILARPGIGAQPAADGDCFLTVVMRTQGRRIPCLVEAMQSLAQQTDSDFEVVLVRHRAESETASLVDAVLAEQTEWLRQRIRVLDLDTGARGAPLNLGFSRATGRYIVAFDDDDLVLPSWVSTFRAMHERAPGQVLRANALRQDVEAVQIDGEITAREVLAPREAWPREFQLLDHLLMNQTPNMTVAFPREFFHELGERFDEELDTTEDWDYLMRAATLLGVAASDEVTAIYRWWVDGDSSHHLHDDSQWARNHDLVQRRLDDRVLLLPRGTVQRLQELVELPRIELAEVSSERDRLAGEVDRLESEVDRLTDNNTTLRRKLTRKRRQLKAGNQQPLQQKSRLFGRKRG